jgi:hypothetical protein
MVGVKGIRYLDMKWIKAVNLLLSTVKCYGGEFNLGA